MYGKLKNATSLYSAIGDEELLEDIRQGDASVLGYIMKKYECFVRAKSRKYFLKGADKEDVFQEGMIGLYRAVLDYDPAKGASFKYFAEICITRQIMNAVNAYNRQKHRAINSYISIEKMPCESEANLNLANIISEGKAEDPEWIYIAKEERDEFRNAMKGKLSKLERDVFALHMIGVPYDEMTKILGKEAKSIDNALQRARSKAQSYMELKLKT